MLSYQLFDGSHKISFKQLSTSDQPLLFQGDFSIYKDPLVRPTQSLEYTLDVDGVVLLTTYFPCLQSWDTWERSIQYIKPLCTSLHVHRKLKGTNWASMQTNVWDCFFWLFKQYLQQHPTCLWYVLSQKIHLAGTLPVRWARADGPDLFCSALMHACTLLLEPQGWACTEEEDWCIQSFQTGFMHAV